MEILIQLVNDIGKLWAKYGASYLTGMRNTLILALTATVPSGLTTSGPPPFW